MLPPYVSVNDRLCVPQGSHRIVMGFKISYLLVTIELS